jgi:hypothetical protein
VGWAVFEPEQNRAEQNRRIGCRVTPSKEGTGAVPRASYLASSFLYPLLALCYQSEMILLALNYILTEIEVTQGCYGEFQPHQTVLFMVAYILCLVEFLCRSHTLRRVPPI